MPAIAALPTPAIATLVWALSRVPSVRRAGAAGLGEPHTLIDAMIAASPEPLPMLRAMRDQTPTSTRETPAA
jgi:2-dehydropantoate 2-reductase